MVIEDNERKKSLNECLLEDTKGIIKGVDMDILRTEAQLEELKRKRGRYIAAAEELLKLVDSEIKR